MFNKKNIEIFNVILCAFFLIYAMIQFSMFNAIGLELLETLFLNEISLAMISSLAFYSNVIALLVIGPLCDHFNSWKILKIILILHGTALFIIWINTNLYSLVFYRIMTGILVGAALPASIKCTINENRASNSGFIITLYLSAIAIGCIIAQSPLVFILNHFNLDMLFFMLLIIDAFLTVLMPKKYSSKNNLLNYKTLNFRLLLKVLIDALKHIDVWLLALFVGLVNLPIFILGDLWGIVFLTETLQISRTTGGHIISMMFFGYVVGSLIIGKLLDLNKFNCLFLMLFGSICIIFILSFLLHAAKFPINLEFVLFFLLGIGSCTQAVGYYLAGTRNTDANVASSVAVISTINVLIGGLSQQFSGYFVNLLTINSSALLLYNLIELMIFSSLLSMLFILLYGIYKKISCERAFT